ncbi:HSF_DOMAIN domain-containing protein [Nephila pilipes]|uniref:HSF_DOMAIN domain-containing protein n=1 Tax=Nephila pilipes TaxID=299642 RepID=A0A8X6MPH5_NEPPI|nr:HSF_DOMAIN domain-containing protein [Nephila pilipes]
MWCFLFLGAVLIASAATDEKCDVKRYIECMEPIHNVTFGHPNGLYQDSNDLATSCPVIKTGIKCIQDFATECGTDMIAENFHEQFERPAEFLTKICDSDSPLRNEYLKASPCLQEHSDDLEVCSTKVQEFLAILDDADTNEKEIVMTCMYEMMLRACLLSTGAEKCQLETASFIRKALLYSPSLGMKTCSKE